MRFAASPEGWEMAAGGEARNERTPLEADEKRPRPECGARTCEPLSRLLRSVFRSIGVPGILDAFHHPVRLIARNRSPTIPRYDFLIRLKKLIDEEKDAAFLIGSVRRAEPMGTSWGKYCDCLECGGESTSVRAPEQPLAQVRDVIVRLLHLTPQKM